MKFRDLSHPKTASLEDSLARCKSLVAQYRLEEQTCIGKDGIIKNIISCRLKHMIEREKRLEALLAKFPAKAIDPKYKKCQSKPETSDADKIKKLSLPAQEGRDLSRPKTAIIQDSLEKCEALIAEYRLEKRSCIRKTDGTKRKLIDCRIYHLLKRKKRIEEILAKYPAKAVDPLHLNCQSSQHLKMRTAPTDADKLNKFALPSQEVVEITLTRADDQIKIIEEDSSWCHSDAKIAHMIELLKFQDRVKNILRIYPNGEWILKRRATSTAAKKPPKEMIPFIDLMNKFDADILRIKEDPMWEMSKYKKENVSRLLELRNELEHSINENEKGKKYLEDLDKDPKVKLSCKLKLALENVESKIAEITDNRNWELLGSERLRTKMEKLRKNKENLENIIRHHNGEDFLKTKMENESAAVKLPQNVMNLQIRDLVRIECQINELEKLEDTKFKEIYMEKLKRTKSSLETSITLNKNGKEYLKQHADKNELLKLEKDLDDVEDELAKIDATKDGKKLPEDKTSCKDELIKIKEDIEKKIGGIEGGKEFLEKRAQSKAVNDPVKLPDEAAESVTKLDEIEKEMSELEKESDSEDKTVRMEELKKSKLETENKIKEFENGQKFLDQRKDGPGAKKEFKKLKIPKKYCTKLPRKVYLLYTLDRINEQIASIEKDSSWCLSDHQSTRMAELLKFKDNVLQILKKFSKPKESKEKAPIELSDEAKKLVEDLDKVEAEMKELETNENSEEVINKKAELEKSKNGLEASIKEQKNGTEFLKRREEEKDAIKDDSGSEEKTEETPKKQAVPKKTTTTLKSIENQMARIVKDDDNWDTNEYKKQMMKHLEKSKANIESIIAKCEGGKEFLEKKAKIESSRIKLPKEANELIRKLDSVENKMDQAVSWKDSGFKKKHLESLQKSKDEVEMEIKKVEKGEEFLKQRDESKAKQDKKYQENKNKAQEEKEKKKTKMDADKAKRRMNPQENDEGDDEEEEPAEVQAKYPKMVVILETLDKVEKMIERIEREVKWCTSKIKTARMIELLRSKENIELFIRKCPGGEEALAKKALEAEAAEKRVPKLANKIKKPQKVTLPCALAAAEILVSNLEKDIVDGTDVIKKTVLEKKLMKFKKLIDSAIEDSPEYKNKKEYDEETEQPRSQDKSSAEDKSKTPSSPRTENPPKKIALICTLKTMQVLTTEIVKDPSYKSSKARKLYYQSIKNREDKLIETLNSLPKEDVSSWHYKNHLKLKAAQEKKDLEDFNRKRCCCPEYQSERSTILTPRSMNLHKPKRAILSYTLNRMGYRMNEDKRQRIRCQLGPKPMKPE